MTGGAGTGPSDTAVVVVNHRTPELTCEAVASALAERPVREVVVVDNGSGDGSARAIAAACPDPRVRLVALEHNRGFGPGVNAGAAEAGQPLLLVLNSDATLVPGAVDRLARVLLADPAVGLVAPAVYGPDGRTLQAGAFGRLPRRRELALGRGWARGGDGAAADLPEPGWVSGAAMLMRRADFLALGGFDEDFEMYFEDVDLCRRLRDAGRSVRRVPEAGVVHLLGRSSQSARERRLRYHRSKLRYAECIGASRPERLLIRLIGGVRARSGRPTA